MEGMALSGNSLVISNSTVKLKRPKSRLVDNANGSL